MNLKFVILLLLVVSFALFGCAKKGQTGNVTQNLSAAQGGTTPENATGASGDKNGNLSDLFDIDTDKPLGNEGFDTGTPSSD
ncbi:MAG: hypothetical protein V1861_01990 [Candidatus Micrarchaeota archaeon]